MGKRGPKPGTGGRPKGSGNSVPWHDQNPYVEFRPVDPDCPFAQHVEKVKAELLEHLGGVESASAPERLIVQQAAMMAAVSRLLTDKLIESGHVSVESTAMFSTWSNTMLRYLQAIGIKKPAVQAASLGDYLAKRSVKKRQGRIQPMIAVPHVREVVRRQKQQQLDG
jgi:hypothetical protein